MKYIILALFLLLLLGILYRGIRVVPQENVWIIERLGKFYRTWDAGLHFRFPIIDKVVRKISLKEQVADFPPRPYMTKDKLSLRMDTVIFFHIINPQLFTYGVENVWAAIENLIAVELCDKIGKTDIEQALDSRETLGAELNTALKAGCEAWGIKVNRAAIKNFFPPMEIERELERKKKSIIAAQEAAEVEKIRRAALRGEEE